MFTHICSQLGGEKVLPGCGSVSIALGAAVLLSAMGIGTPAFADPPVLGALTQISGPSPFDGCTADDVPGQEDEGSVNFPDSEVEPYVHVNPTDTDNVVAVWQQDRWSDGGARGLLSAVSDDGGKTWETVTPPEFTVCSDGSLRASHRPMGGLRTLRQCLFHEPVIRLRSCHLRRPPCDAGQQVDRWRT